MFASELANFYKNHRFVNQLNVFALVYQIKMDVFVLKKIHIFLTYVNKFKKTPLIVLVNTYIAFIASHLFIFYTTVNKHQINKCLT